MASIAEEETAASFLDGLPRVERGTQPPILQYKGFWFFRRHLESIIYTETQYNPLPTDVLIASFPKSGTTWLKAIAFEILHVNASNDLLETHSPHQLIPFLETEILKCKGDIEIPSPRIFSTHIPYSMLSNKVKDSSSGCKIIYVSRNPADIIVSGWKFFCKTIKCQLTLQEYFDDFLNGLTTCGPLFEHVSEYWEERQKENVLFITYEGLKKYPNKNVEKIAKFIGCSLSDSEIEKVVRNTSFEHLSKLAINTNEENKFFVAEQLQFSYSSFFRNGNVGDGKSCLTPEMMERLNAIAYQKWEGSGLELKLLDVDEA